MNVVARTAWKYLGTALPCLHTALLWKSIACPVHGCSSSKEFMWPKICLGAREYDWEFLWRMCSPRIYENLKIFFRNGSSFQLFLINALFWKFVIVRNKNGKKKYIVWNLKKKIIDKQNKASFKCKYCQMSLCPKF